MKSGIYKIINILNNKFYIGSSVDLKKRFREHIRRLKRNTHHCVYLQNSFNKYGENNFKFEIIEYCDILELKIKEQYYLDNLFPHYNTSKSSRCPMQGRKHSLETLEKFKFRNYSHGQDHYLFGKKMSKEHIENMLKAREGYRHSEETKNKMSETSKRLNRYKDLIPSIEKNKKKIIDSRGNIFNSMTECAEYWDISIQTVCDILKKRHLQTRKKVSFKYV